MISVSSSIGSATWVGGGDISGAIAWVAPGTVVSAHTNGNKAHHLARCLSGLNKVRIDSFMCPALNVQDRSSSPYQRHFTAMPPRIVKTLLNRWVRRPRGPLLAPVTAHVGDSKS